MKLRTAILMIVAVCSGVLSAQSDYRTLLFDTGDIILLRADSLFRKETRSIPPQISTTVTGTVIMRYDRSQGKFTASAYDQVSAGVYDSRWTAAPRETVESGKLYILFIGRGEKERVVQHGASVLAFENYTIADPGHFFSPDDVMSIESFEQLLRKSFF